MLMDSRELRLRYVLLDGPQVGRMLKSPVGSLVGRIPHM